MRAFADTPAPSQVAAWTRGPIVESFLSAWELNNARWDPNFRGTGNGLLRIGGKRQSPPIWIVAHWDAISFLIDKKMDDQYLLIPFHHHVMTEGTQPGLVLRYDVSEAKYATICEGIIVGGQTASFAPIKDVELRKGDRVVYHTPMQQLKGDLYSGQMDNAAGCAAALLAGAFLSRIPDLNALVCFVDEEEGPVAHGNTAFARGSKRLLRELSTPKIALAVDLHNVGRGERNPHLGKGAVFHEQASHARGAVTPPWLYDTVRELAARYAPDVRLLESTSGGVHRGDCTSLMEVTPNVVLCGPPSTGRHYVDGPYVCSSSDVAQLARSLAVITHHFQSCP